MRIEVPGEEEPRADLDETPPLMGSWPKLYALVVGSQAVLVLVFYLLTRLYS
ncbi:MAG: hypothetical protein ACQEXJ_06060 [Myxococcota bacterium]